MDEYQSKLEREVKKLKPIQPSSKKDQITISKSEQ